MEVESSVLELASRSWCDGGSAATQTTPTLRPQNWREPNNLSSRPQCQTLRKLHRSAWYLSFEY